MTVVDREHCVRAVQAKDARFDGWFITAVTSTRIYCRPSCPVVPPKVENMTFYPSSAAAQQAGFRACKRCRPDTSPGSPQWNERADVVARAMRLIADGVVDREGVPGLASRLGYSTRQVERQVRAELGAGPLALARAQRAQTARLMIETTAMAMSEVASASGFASIRAFNDTVREVFGVTPTELRARSGARDPSVTTSGDIDLRLPFRRPLAAADLFGHLAAVAVGGVEQWRDGAFRRTLRLPHGHGVAELRPPGGPDDTFLRCRLSLTDFRDLPVAITRCRRLLDLDADPVAADGHLATDPDLAPLVRRDPGRRLPGAVDPVEAAVRAVVATRSAVDALVRSHGREVADGGGTLTSLFPTTGDLALADPEALPVPRDRARSVVGLARAVADGGLVLDAGADRAESRRALLAVPGITTAIAEEVAMTALGDPDAFPAAGLGLRGPARALALDPERARRWSPWRSYALRYLAAPPGPVGDR